MKLGEGEARTNKLTWMEAAMAMLAKVATERMEGSCILNDVLLRLVEDGSCLL